MWGGKSHPLLISQLIPDGRLYPAISRFHRLAATFDKGDSCCGPCVVARYLAVFCFKPNSKFSVMGEQSQVMSVLWHITVRLHSQPLPIHPASACFRVPIMDPFGSVSGCVID